MPRRTIILNGYVFNLSYEEYTAVHSFHIMIMEKVEEAGEIYGRTVLALFTDGPSDVRRMIVNNYGGVRLMEPMRPL